MLLLLFIAVVVGQEFKPCPGNENKFKCDENGFFSKIQSDGESFCVSPQGLPAYDTRTNGTPKCGACFEKLHEIFKNGLPSRDVYHPLCELGNGDYDLVQCNKNTDKCHCTERDGTVVEGTEQPWEEGTNITCGGKVILIEYYRFTDFTNSDSYKIENTHDTNMDCAEKSLRYVFSQKHGRVMAYKGCGDFATPAEAKQSQDANTNSFFEPLSCPGGSKAMDWIGYGFNCVSGRPSQSLGPKLNEEGCPQGYSCTKGSFFGICCNVKQTEKAKATTQTCPNGKPPARIEGTSDELLSWSCDANHCPVGHTCHQNFLFAFCCPQ